MAGWIGRTLSKVEIHKLQGRGGMAEVYLGRHTTLDRPVAVKILHGHLSGDETLLARFRSEAQAVASLRHPNIIQVYDFDVADDQPYIVMELLEGPSLADYLHVMHRAERRFPPETVARLVGRISRALDYAHNHGIVHRDVKPSNVLLRREHGLIDVNQPLTDDIEPVLTDFGVARLANATIRTASGVIVGTPAYMSPEQVSGEQVDARSDIYSLGIMLYEMIAGRLPFDSDSDTVASTLIKHITEPPPPLPETTPNVQAVVFRALAKSRAERYQTAGDMAFDLRTAFGLPVTPVDTLMLPPRSNPQLAARVRQETDSASKIQPKRPSRMILAAGIVLILIALGIAGVILGLNLLDEEAPSTPDDSEGNVSAETVDYGELAFTSDSDTVDQVTLTVNGLTAPAENTQYEAWLLGGETRRSLGVLTVNTDGTGQLNFTDSSGDNLLTLFDQFEITVEPNPDSNPLPTADIIYVGSAPPEALMHIRHLIVSFGGAPGQIGLTTGILRHAQLMQETAQAMVDSWQENDLAGMKRHAEALVNIIEGENGEHYGDQDGDDQVFNPGDGFGLLPNGANAGYIQGTIEHARYSAGTPDSTPTVAENAGYLEAAAQNLGGWAAELRDAAMLIAQSDDLASVEEPVQRVNDLADLFLNGQDTDGDSEITPAEGGAVMVYHYAQHMADMPVTPR